MSGVSRVLVLMAVYNGQPWIGQQVESVLTQVGIDLHLLIRDDHSNDGSLEFMINRYGNLSNVTIQASGSNSGSAGRNFYDLFMLADASKSDYVAFCDQDDIWHSDKLSNAISALSNQQFSGYSSAVNAVYEDGKVSVLRQSSKSMLADFLFEGAGQGCTFVLPATVFQKIQIFMKDNFYLIINFHFHDWLSYILIRSWGCHWFFDNSPTMLYRQHSSNDIGARGGIISIVRRLRLIHSGWYKKQLLIAASIYIKSGQKNKLIYEFILNLGEKDSILRRIKISKFIYFHGRRRILDRFILVVSALLGFL